MVYVYQWYSSTIPAGMAILWQYEWVQVAHQFRNNHEEESDGMMLAS
jgi:hypothetical protein